MKPWHLAKIWFDSDALGTAEELAGEKPRVDWVRTAPFFLIHLACLAVLWVGWSPVAVGVAALLYVVRMFAITGFYHRYFSHRTFRTSRAFQFVAAALGNSALQRGPLWWASHHRFHHRHSDEQVDIHSPRQHGFLWSHMLWLTSPTNYATREELIPDLVKYPELRFLNRFDLVVPLLLAAALYALGAGLAVWAPGLGTSGMQMLVWGFVVSTVVLLHGTCTINSLAHVFGGRRYATPDDSRNSLLLSLVTLGEGWHNNHHHYPGSTRQGFFWWEIDLTYYGLLLLSWLGLISDLRPVPEAALRNRLVAEQGAG